MFLLLRPLQKGRITLRPMSWLSDGAGRRRAKRVGPLSPHISLVQNFKTAIRQQLNLVMWKIRSDLL